VARDTLREAELDALMGRLAHGERAAFAPLYAALHPRALRLARARLGRDRAPDVAQSALLKVFARASEFVPGRPCLPWFYAVVSNEVRGALRVRQGDALPPDDALVDPGDGESQLAACELERALAVAIDSLDHASAEAVAAMLGDVPRPAVSPETFRKRLSRAYGRLRLLRGEHDGS
jgi:DNA-directed RNA polymerase specialized sigma24 family protein